MPRARIDDVVLHDNPLHPSILRASTPTRRTLMTAVRRSFAYSLADNYLGVVLQLISTFVISRLLSPGEIGIFSVAAALIALASTFRDFGVAEYLIQAPKADDRRLRAALAANLAVSWSVAALLLVVSVPAGNFYRNDGVATVLQVLSVNFLLIPFGAVTMACFRRELNYGPIFAINVASSIASFLVTIAAALAGLSFMSMAWGALAGIVVTIGVATLLRPAGMPWLPSLRGIGEVFQFGKFATGSYMVEQLGRSAPEAVIGRVVDLASVAIFSRANGILEIFNRAVMRAVLQVCLPYFAQRERASGDARADYVRTAAYVTAVGWPFFLVVLLLAYPLIRTLYGQQWLASVVLAQVLCVAAMVELPCALTSEMLVAKGRIDMSTRLQMLTQGIRVVGVLAFVPFGLLAVCWALAVIALVNNSIAAWHLWKVIGLRPIELMRGCASSAVVAVGTAAPVLLIAAAMSATDANHLTVLALTLPAAAVAWLLCIALTGNPIWAEVQQLTRYASSWRRGRGRP